MPNFQLTERVAIVTGASRGLGVAIAEGLAEQGARVVLSSRKQEDLDREAARLNERFPGSAVAIAVGLVLSVVALALLVWFVIAAVRYGPWAMRRP